MVTQAEIARKLGGSRQLVTFVRKNLAQRSRHLGYARAMQEAKLETEFIHYPPTENLRPVAEMCAAACKFLQQRLDKPGAPSRQMLLSPKLNIPESSLPPA